MVSEFIQESLDHLLSGHTLVRGGMLRNYIGCVDVIWSQKCDYKWWGVCQETTSDVI
jgi:hypothetical protein